MRLPRRLISVLDWLLAATILVFAGLSPVPANAQMKFLKDLKKGIQERTSPDAVFVGKHFRCLVPKKWELKKSEDGLFLAGPGKDALLPPKIAVDYYGAGNPSFKDADDYLQTNRDGGIPLKDEKTGPIEKMRVAQLPAKGFFRDTFEYIPPNSLHPVKVPVREEYIVLPYGDGFFVLVYSTQASSYRLYYPVFQRLVDSFHPLP